MPKTHIVGAGECISSIAAKYGFFPDTLWELPENAALKALRDDPNILQRGDKVHIPDLGKRQENREAGQRHKFRRKGVPDVLKLRFVDPNGEPRAGLAYILRVDGNIRDGKTDSDGWVNEWIRPHSKQGELELTTADGSIEAYELDLGHLNPITEPEGIRERLEHLGFPCGTTDEQLASALSQFQMRYELEPTGEADSATVEKLKEVHLR